MAELYTSGVNRIIYKAENFTTGATVTAFFWNPTLVKSALQTFVEIEEGLYYLDYDFTQSGTYAAIFFENAIKKLPGTFRITELALASVCTETRLAELAAANLPADVNAILTDTGTDGVIVAAGSKTGYALSAAGVDAILDEEIESTTTLRQMLRILTAALAGKSTGGGTATIAFRDILDLKDRISATVDASGNRTAISVDGT